MSTIGDEPAHPTQDFYDERLIGITPGLTKREYFALHLTQALLSSQSIEIATKWGVEAADKLIEKLNKP